MSRPALSPLAAQVIGWAAVADDALLAVPLFVARWDGQVPTGHRYQERTRAVAAVLDKGAVRPAFHFVKGVAAMVGY